MATPKPLKSIKVGVFEHDGPRRTSLVAYTTWYNPEWSGCCEHTVQAINGTAAKAIATAEHRVKCMREAKP